MTPREKHGMPGPDSAGLVAFAAQRGGLGWTAFLAVAVHCRCTGE
jgi:hypothetical protein